jgi:hypothetical protein
MSTDRERQLRVADELDDLAGLAAKYQCYTTS